MGTIELYLRATHCSLAVRPNDLPRVSSFAKCVLGCGRFFEGTPEEMDTALNKTLGSLPDDAKVYVGYKSVAAISVVANSVQPGHEYTRGNVKFAIQVSQAEPIKKLQSLVDSNKQTPGKSTLGDEKVCKTVI